MPTRNVNLTEHFDRFIEAGITSGRFGNASEVVREGLRLLEQREQEDRAQLEWLRAAVKEGFITAQRDIKAVLKWSEKEFGKGAAARYRVLIKQAVFDIGADPERPGSQDRTDLLVSGARTYHLSFSRSRVGGPGVKEPRHFLVYRRCEDGAIEVGRVIHDSRDLDRHVPEEYRRGKE
jgi:toxin ParE1/3/4